MQIHKIFTIACFLLGPSIIKAQFNSEKFSYTQIDSSKGTKTELFVKARIWVANAFVSAKDVIQMEDKDAGKIIAKGLFKIEGAKGGFGNLLGYDNVWFTISIDVKDSKYRCVLSDYKHEGGNYNGSSSGGLMSKDTPDCGTFFLPKSRWNKFKLRAREQSEEILKKLSETMNNPLPSSEF